MFKIQDSDNIKKGSRKTRAQMFYSLFPIPCSFRAQRGNFMLQALLALSLVIAFMPMLVKRVARTGADTQMNAAVSQIESLVPAIRAFGRDFADSFVYGVSVYEGRDFADALEPFGLPIGFVPRTPFGQRITMIVTRDEVDTAAWIRMTGGNLSGVERAELALRIGFWAGEPEGNIITGATGGWEVDMSVFRYRPAAGSLYVRVPLSAEFSDLLYVRARNIEENRMHVNLNMGGRDIRNTRDVSAIEGRFRSVLAGDMVLSGVEDGRRLRHRFGDFRIRRASFQTRDGSNALNIARGSLRTSHISAPTVSRFGDLGSLVSDVVSVHSFGLSAGQASFSGPSTWRVDGDVILHNVSLSVERMELSEFINAGRGQDVFVDEEEQVYATASGIEAGLLVTTALTLRDQTSNRLLAGGTGPVILDVRPAGVSILPDVLVAGIDNGGITALADPAGDFDTPLRCETIISRLNVQYDSIGQRGLAVRYDERSLAQNIVCRFMAWQRLEQRINIMRCIQEGRDDC